MKTPPLSAATRRDAGFLLRQLQAGETLSMPHSKPMRTIGPRCHELRLTDGKKNAEWRIIYRVDPDAIVIGDVFQKKTRRTPQAVIQMCKKRFRDYDAI